MHKNKHHKLMLVFWNIIYWCSIAFGTIFSRFFQRYWRTGNFTLFGRVLEALKLVALDIIALIVLLGGLILIVVYVFGINQVSSIKSAFIVLNHVYGMIVLTGLLGYGLFQLPLYIWSRSHIDYLFYKNIAKASGVYDKYRDAQVELYRHANICRNAIEYIKKQHNYMEFEKQVDMLEDSIPEQYDDGIDIKGNRNIEPFKLNK